MAGFRTFATGEVLTAANVNNFLMGQSVMRFADADARTAALGADVVEGMLTYNLATDQLEVFDGTNFVVAAPEPPAGIGSNVVQTVKTDVFTTTSNDFTALTGLAATITPTVDTSRVFVIATMTVASTAGTTNAQGRLMRSATPIFVGTDVSSRTPAAFQVNSANNTATSLTMTLAFLDNPATNVAVTYSVELRRSLNAGTVFVNRTQDDTDNAGHARTASSLTVIEVAA